VPNNPGDVQDVQRFMLIQDTGGAIRGHGRADLFWGSDAGAEWIAANAKQPGRVFVLVAKKDALPPPDAPAGHVRAPVAAPRAPGRAIQARMP
jgi:membrane-bound lytic murein transglycosylase A